MRTATTPIADRNASSHRARPHAGPYELRRMRRIAARRQRTILVLQLIGLVLLAIGAALAGAWLGWNYKD